MAQKKRAPKRKASPKKKTLQISSAMRKILQGLPKPARAVIDRMDEFKRAHPKLYELITRDVDTPYYRQKVERRIERLQKQKREQQ